MNKTETAFWLVSHCTTVINREGYMTELQKFIKVNVYGRCGVEECTRQEQINYRTLTDYKKTTHFPNLPAERLIHVKSNHIFKCLYEYLNKKLRYRDLIHCVSNV